MTHAGTAEQNCWNLIYVASIVKIWEYQICHPGRRAIA